MTSFKPFGTALLPAIALLAALIATAGCNAVKNVPDNQYLLNSVRFETKGGDIPAADLDDYARQKPNKKIFGFMRFHLGVYNLANPENTGRFNNWLREIGEQPVIYDPSSTRETIGQLKKYLANVGYYDAKVDDTLLVANKRARVVYRVDFGEPYMVERVRLASPELISDKAIRSLIIADSANSLLKPGMRYDLEVLRLERMRVSNFLRDRGYYGFSREYVYFQADTLKGNHRADVSLGIKNPKDAITDVSRLNFHPLYLFGRTSILSDFNTAEYLKDPQSYHNTSDTVFFNGTGVIFRDRLKYKPALLASTVAFRQGNLFSQGLVDKTIESFSSLRNFRQIKVNFLPAGNPADSVQQLDCQILLSPMVRQAYDIALEATYSSGNIGAAGNLIYKNRNLLKGAENFELRFKGAVEFLSNAVGDFNRMVEFGVDSRLEVPRSRIPFMPSLASSFGRPHASFNLSFNYQRRPDFTRTIANGAFGYNWKTPLSRHQFNIFELNYVNVSEMSDEFYNIIRGTYVENSFRSHMVHAVNYTLTYSTQELNKESSFLYLRVRPEVAGNLLYGVYRIAGQDMPERGYELFGTPFSQYAEADIDLRYHWVMSSSNRLAFRVFAGAGFPYGNSDAMPFEKKYFSGGSSGIRAWQVRSLGPGAYVIPEDQKGLYPNQLGDIKLEFNAEYRFDLFSFLKGAVFLDAGNIWAISPADTREGALFRGATFLDQMAVGTGFGLRADLSYFLGRLDLGIKLKDPGTPEGPKWIPGYRKYGWGDFVLNFGIGYPF